ncbi:MAG: hypothetical protein LUC31_03525, partial [Coprobacillus sp.]|nr:hypothetical protein [Coprobacillus sp.]
GSGSGESGGTEGDEPESGEGDDGSESDEDEEEDPEEAVAYPYEEEDTEGYPVLYTYNVLNNYVYYTGERVVVEGATVVGLHGKTLTIQQAYSSSYYTLEVEAMTKASIPEGLKIGSKVDIIGTVTTKYGRRVVLDEARIQTTGTAGIAAYAKIRLIDRDAENYFYYSGGVIKHEYRVLYEVEKNSTEWKESFSELNLYRAFRVEWRNWYKPTSGYSCGTDRGETYIVVYNDIEESTKQFYDLFFDGTGGEDMTSVHSNFTSSWSGLIPTEEETINDINDYHWFEGYTKYQYYYENFYVSFDEFEAQYLTNFDYTTPTLADHENVSAILSGFFEDGDEVTVTGIYMEQHGNNITIQEYDTSTSQGTGYCLEVELAEEWTNTIPYAYLITLKGTIALHESPTLYDYTHTLVNASVEEFDSTTYGDNSNKTRLYYGSSSINSISSNIYGEYSAAYFHAGVQVYSLPDTWEDGKDYWFLGRLRYKSGSITYVTSEYIPVVVHGDASEDELNFFKAVLFGVDEDENEVTVTKSHYEPYGDTGINIHYVTTINGAPTVAPGFEGIDVGEIIMSNFYQVHYFDEEKEFTYHYNGTEYTTTNDRYLSFDFNSMAVADFSSSLGN